MLPAPLLVGADSHLCHRKNDNAYQQAYLTNHPAASAAAPTGELDFPYLSQDLNSRTMNGALLWSRYMFLYFERLRLSVPPVAPYSDVSTGIYRMYSNAIITPAGTDHKAPAQQSVPDLTIAMCSDWAAGTLESFLVAEGMRRLKPAYTIHLGDIYFFGEAFDVQRTCFGNPTAKSRYGVVWPHGSHGSLAIPGNHEYISAGEGFLRHFMPSLGFYTGEGDRVPRPVKSLGQSAPYWCLENDHWRIIGLDTGYHSFSAAHATSDKPDIDLSADAITWLKKYVFPSPAVDKRGLLFLLHHQVVSGWSKVQDQKFPKTLARIIPRGRQVLILWGHEHRLAFYRGKKLVYREESTELNFFGRCIGHGGFPTETIPPIHGAESGLIAYDDRKWDWTETHRKRLFFSQAGHNGYVALTFRAPSEAAPKCACSDSMIKGYEHEPLNKLSHGQASLVIDYYTLNSGDTTLLEHDNDTHVAREYFGTRDGHVKQMGLSFIDDIQEINPPPLSM